LRADHKSPSIEFITSNGADTKWSLYLAFLESGTVSKNHDSFAHLIH